MNILMVDDEVSAIEAVRNGIQWVKLGVGEIYTATSVSNAISMFKENSIDILLSDIEMPMGTGLDLLRWTNENYPNVKCIFMTCHADFNFLQEAMHLGSIDYILKPLNFTKVESVIQSTIDKIFTEKLLKENSHSWLQNKKIVVKQFWKDFFLGEISPNKDSLMNYFRLKRLDFNLEDSYLPIIVSTKKWTEPMSKDDQKLLQYALRNMTEEMVVIPETTQEVLPFSDTSILIMLHMDPSVDEQTVYKQIDISCCQLSDAARKHIKEIVCCYVGKKGTIFEMPAAIELLQMMDFNDVIYDPKVLFLYQEEQNHELTYTDHPFMKWREWLQHGGFAQVLNEIMNHLTPQDQQNGINRDYLKKFARDFYYLIVGFASDRNIFINELYGNEQSNRLLEEASESLGGLLQWVNYAIGIMQNYDHENTSRNTPVDKTKDYIHQHLSEEITMVDIANNVHLNADYLTRIFKKEVGVSISKYMINMKIEKAKELLENTDKSIGDIAMIVGYYNYSSFNRIFTKDVGMSPQEYKNSRRKK
ncbi:response regulator transcription factor [Paenibacillus sinopodophylli]|uniref:response regulator transcription factor n=1 Tax=Paenibacillus sinopodophylli TaxID=1837342 RepID=UPI00110CCAAF|nr:response regulator [Paenibacillus sinopodophylli]